MATARPSIERITDRISISKSRDLTWKKVAVVLDCKRTEWFDSHAEAIAYARGLDIGLIDSDLLKRQHEALRAVAEAAHIVHDAIGTMPVMANANLEKSWRVLTDALTTLKEIEAQCTS